MHRLHALGLAALACLFASCSPSSDKPAEDAPPPDTIRIGAVMMETGRRFETAGRASTSGRWELAEYEVHEILELFEADMPRALLPGDCNDEVADAMFEDLDRTQLAALRQAAGDRDEQAFRSQFARVSASCNGCHTACQVPFVEVPSEPGGAVPRLDPMATP